ncbi:MAG: OmpA family protein [Pseudomonadota bacterium]
MTVALSSMALTLASAAMASAVIAATEVPLPAGAVETAWEVTDPDIYELPIGRFTAERAPVAAIAGHVTTRAWRWPREGSEPLAVKLSLRAAFLAQGYRLRHSCSDDGCGGFDFRYQTRVLPSPMMEVDLNAFSFLALQRHTDAGQETLSFLISRSPRGNYLQAIEVTPSAVDAPVLSVPPALGPAARPDADIFAGMEDQGRAVLPGMDFAPGVTDVAPDVRSGLAQIARFMVTYPEARIVIVGHTDNVGSLESNIRVGRERAAAVRRALIEDYAIAPDRLDVAGAGFLAPLQRNDSEAGRAANRRVEIILR